MCVPERERALIRKQMLMHSFFPQRFCSYPILTAFVFIKGVVFSWKQIVLKPKLISVLWAPISIGLRQILRKVLIIMGRSTFLKRRRWSDRATYWKEGAKTNHCVFHLSLFERLRPDTLKQSWFSLYKSCNRPIHQVLSVVDTYFYSIWIGLLYADFLPCWLP